MTPVPVRVRPPETHETQTLDDEKRVQRPVMPYETEVVIARRDLRQKEIGFLQVAVGSRDNLATDKNSVDEKRDVKRR